MKNHRGKSITYGKIAQKMFHAGFDTGYNRSKCEQKLKASGVIKQVLEDVAIMYHYEHAGKYTCEF